MEGPMNRLLDLNALKQQGCRSEHIPAAVKPATTINCGAVATFAEGVHKVSRSAAKPSLLPKASLREWTASRAASP